MKKNLIAFLSLIFILSFPISLFAESDNEKSFSSDIAKLSFQKFGDIEKSTSLEEQISTIFSGNDSDKVILASSYSCSTGCSSGCSSGCSNGCSSGCSSGCSIGCSYGCSYGCKP